MKILFVVVVVVAVALAAVVNVVNDVINVKDVEIAPVSDDDVVVGDGDSDIVWFLQITDIHLSIFQDDKRKGSLAEFRTFCGETVKTIGPAAVVASGDLTDAKTRDRLGSRQYKQEWEWYRSTLVETGVTNVTTWLDIRGNHDSFNILSVHNDDNMFKDYSVQGPVGNLRSYTSSISRNGVNVSFIGLDPSPQPGAKRPFNFIGILNRSQMDHLEALARTARSESDHIIWFGHYPTSSIVSPSPGVRQAMSGALCYLCGHYHSMFGLVRQMYTRQHTGVRELELEDWMGGRKYRLLAVDHGIMTFSDIEQSSSSWPVVHITWPPPPHLTSPNVEPLHRLAKSTHVRSLVFSPHPITTCTVVINNSPPTACSTTNGELFTAPWNTSTHQSGTITVTVADAAGLTKTVSQQFSVTTVSWASSSFLPRFLLMSSVTAISQLLFSLLLSATTLPLCVFRLWSGRPLPANRTLALWCRRLFLLSHVDCLFWPLVLTPVYIALGPWLVGELIHDHTGIIFIWGTWVAGSFLPGTLTYLYAAIHLAFATLPTQLFLAVLVETRHGRVTGRETATVTFSQFVWANIPFLLVLAGQIWMIYLFYGYYGAMAAVLGPFKTWTTIVNFALWLKVSKLDQSSFRFL